MRRLETRGSGNGVTPVVASQPYLVTFSRLIRVDEDGTVSIQVLTLCGCHQGAISTGASMLRVGYSGGQAHDRQVHNLKLGRTKQSRVERHLFFVAGVKSRLMFAHCGICDDIRRQHKSYLPCCHVARNIYLRL
jgi:hypothetical protein